MTRHVQVDRRPKSKGLGSGEPARADRFALALTIFGALPDWPALLNDTQMRKFTGFTKGELRELIEAGILPKARLMAGKAVWSTDEVRRAVAAYFEADHAENQRQRSRRLAEEALDAFESPALRSRNPIERPNVPLLPARR